LAAVTSFEVELAEAVQSFDRAKTSVEFPSFTDRLAMRKTFSREIVLDGHERTTIY
jgi:hypothetical protein